jgi:hypothetical protein
MESLYQIEVLPRVTMITDSAQGPMLESTISHKGNLNESVRISIPIPYRDIFEYEPCKEIGSK